MSLINDYLKKMEKNTPPDADKGGDVPPSLLIRGRPTWMKAAVVMAIILPAFGSIGLCIHYWPQIEAFFSPISDDTLLQKHSSKTAPSPLQKGDQKMADKEKAPGAGKGAQPSPSAAPEKNPSESQQPTAPAPSEARETDKGKSEGAPSSVQSAQKDSTSAPPPGAATATGEKGATGGVPAQALPQVSFSARAPAEVQPQGQPPAASSVTLAPPGKNLKLPGWRYPSNVSGAPPTPPVEARDGGETEAQDSYQSGLAAQKAGDLKEAERHYLKALKRQKGHPDSITNLSAIYIKQTRYSEAEEILKGLGKSAVANSKALVNSGAICLHRREYEKAKELFTSALAVDPGEEAAMVNLAYIAQQENDQVARESYYERILDMYPENLDILLAYASFCESRHRYVDALGYYRRSLVLERTKANAQFRQAVSNRIQLLESMLSGKSNGAGSR